MIRSLRKKFILIASGAILIILTIVLLCINGISYYSSYSEAMSILSFITDNYGRMPDEDPHNDDVDFHVTRELRYETRYFSVILDSEGEFVTTDYEHISSVTENEMSTFYENVLNNKRDKGTLKISDSTYLFRKKNASGDDLIQSFSEIKRPDNNDPEFDADKTYKIIVFMDCTNRMYRVRIMSIFSTVTGIICFIVFVILVSIFSRRAVKPVIETYEKQKQFITNAGHELKTPLAIISANTEVMEAMDGKTEWTQSTLNQVKRLSGLVNDLITLARLEESADRDNIAYDEIDLSAKFKETAGDFHTLAEQQGKKLETHIDENIKIQGNEKSIHELISILMDNAAKYCDENGIIRAELIKQKKQVVLTVSNSYKDGEKIDYSRFFERFYREDSSHNHEKAGYGIGLSMAETIVRLHKGKISADYRNGEISFRVILPEK